MTNKEIEEKLLLTNNQVNKLEHSSANAIMFRKYISKWNNKEYPLTLDLITRLIRLNEWTKEDLSFDNELLIRKYLPEYMVKVFLDVKDFRSNSRNELLSTQELFAKMYGYPYNTQDEKAFCVYKYALQIYTE